MKQIVLIAALALGLVGCETTGYRKSSGGQTAHKTVKVVIGKGAQISGNVVVDLYESQSNTGSSEQGGTAEGAVSPQDSLNGNDVGQ